MRRLLLVVFALALACAAAAQAPPVVADLSSTTCPGTGCVTAGVGGYATAGVDISGTFTGTLTFKTGIASLNNVGCTKSPASSTASNTTTTGGYFFCPVGAASILQVVVTSGSMTGTAHVVISAVPAGGAGSGGGGGGGGGGAVTIADGADAALGTTTDGAVTGDNDGTLIGHVRYLDKAFADIWDPATHTIGVKFASTPTVSVTNAGTFAVQLTGATNNINNVTGTVSLPTGAATSANQSTEITNLQTIAGPAATNGTTTYTDTSTKGFVLSAIRKDTGATLSGTNGTASPLQVDSSGNLRVNIAAGAAAGGTSLSDGTTFTASTTSLTPVGGFYHSTVDSVADGKSAAFGMTIKRALFTSIYTPAGTSAINETAASVRSTLYDASGNALTQDTQGQQDSGLGTITNVTGGMTFYRASTATTGAVSADDDAVLGWADRNGRLHVTGDASMGKLLVTPDANSAVNIAQVNGQTVQAGNGSTSTGTQRVTIANDSTGVVAPVATAVSAGGTSTCYITSAASTNSTSCKTSAGNVYAVHVTNTTTTNYFLRMYNDSNGGGPTCSSSTGFVETIPALGAAANGGVNGRSMGIPQAYSTGIGFCLTGGGANNDNTNAATGVYITIEYK